ncbi:MAG: permease [Firmicutes bacterium]|nr:permease [Bacillota bacterium]
MHFTVALWLAAGVALAWSRARDPGKTRLALAKCWRSFEGILPQFAGVLLLIGTALTVLSPSTISALVGRRTGIPGMLLTSAVGAITLIPGFIAFPLAKTLLDMGAGVQQVAVFISTLMMVGVATAPMEARYFGKKATLLRNTLAYILSFVTASIVGMVAGR